jgi:hypothetical protein
MLLTDCFCDQDLFNLAKECKMTSHLQRHPTKDIVLAIALTLPGISAFAQSSYVVKSGTDKQMEQPYGRDSVRVPQPPLVLSTPNEPQLYGRAGEYVGTDRVVALESRLPRAIEER